MSRSARDLVTASQRRGQRVHRLAQLVHPDASSDGKLQVLTRGAWPRPGVPHLGLIVMREEISDLIVEGDRPFVLYPRDRHSVRSGALPELRDRRHGGSDRPLTFDWRRWPVVLQELQARTALRRHLDPATPDRNGEVGGSGGASSNGATMHAEPILDAPTLSVVVVGLRFLVRPRYRRRRRRHHCPPPPLFEDPSSNVMTTTAPAPSRAGTCRKAIDHVMTEQSCMSSQMFG